MVSQVAKSLALSVAEYITCYFIFTIITMPLHEWIHLSVARMLGGDGYIIATPFGALTVLTKTPQHFYLVALSGGILTALLFLLLFFWDVYDDDFEEYCSLIPLITSQLGYSIFEGIFVASMSIDSFVAWGTAVLLTCWAIGAVVSIAIYASKVKERILLRG
jgi:hypothetical protein